ncbi:hypothetical protein [Halopenitus persicus]|uniref:hypothetical protein n=1 Tax=Halopenitus persicus TaxID=1048396 RepID=UPI0012FD9AC1|nr:hypothetical protein [Halopenitus persicus]
MSRAIALLTLDVASALYNPTHMPNEVVLKHTDGELIKARQADTGDWLSERRKELEVNFLEDGRYDTPTSAVAAVADRQAFGFRANGEAVNPLTVVGSSRSVETIEVEGLGLGGIIVEDEQQLPLAVYTRNEVYYRIRISEEERDVDVTEQIAVLEKRKGPRGEWTERSRAEPSEAGYLLESIAEETDMETTSGDSDELQESIDNKQELFKASRTQEDEDVRERMAIQNDTVFSPSIPKPRPVDFPS